ncbi:MAG TPA: transposase family protein [Oculatellaceae cyanobacterium]
MAICEQFKRRSGGVLADCVGIIDGTRVDILGPQYDRASYFDWKKVYSIVFLVIVDYSGRVLWLSHAAPGCVNDVNLAGLSKLDEGVVNLRAIADRESLFLIGDGGFSLRPHLVIPFDETDIKKRRNQSLLRRFNRFFSGIRCTVERVLGVVKGRWRCILGGLRVRIKSADSSNNHRKLAMRIIQSCFILHNFSLVHDGGWDAVWGRFQNEVPNVAEAIRLASEEVIETKTEHLSLETLVNGQKLRDNLLEMYNIRFE